MRILVVEDNESVLESLNRGLHESGYAVQVATTGAEALERATADEYDLLILDRMLPELSGDEVCRRLRQQESSVPILMLTARAEIGDRVEGLDLGADDYLTKPFAFAELLARVRALLRRGEALTPAILRLEDLQLDPSARTVTRAGKPISLSLREFALLDFLMRNAGRVVTRESIVSHVWGQPLASNAVEVYITYLRRKIDKGHAKKLIHNVRGVGYVMRVEP
jgi:DNA-binding response OmpR family regulator